jgi:CubicO group peptidase (beta-lactamase class C family)
MGGLRAAEAGQPPERLDDGWQVSTPADAGLDETLIAKITSDIATGRFEGIHSYLIVKNGKLVHEAYFDGYGREDLQTIFSITKSLTSTLVGIAIERNEISGTGATLPELLPEYTEVIADGRARSVTLEHLLTLTSGFEWDEKTHPYNDPRNSEYRMVTDGHWVEHFLGLPVRDEPGTRYVYNTGSVHLISAIIRSRTGLYADEYTERYLFEPLAIEDFKWNKDPQGYPCTGGTHGGLRLRSRDLAKFAYLFLNGGRWMDS